MGRKNAIILVLVWVLVMCCIAASATLLFSAGASGRRTRWVSAEEYAVIERYGRLEEVRKALSEGYYEQLDDETLLTGAIRGMMASVEDPYTFYYTPEQMEKRNQEAGSAYVGVGLLVQNNADGFIEVIRVYADTPADQAGILSGDLLVRVDGAPVSGRNSQTLEAAVARIKGKAGTEVTLTLLRGGAEMEFVLERREVASSNISSSLLEGDIGYIDIFQFTGDAAERFDAALMELQEKGARALVIDLRNNPGGMLDQVVQIADRLLPKGTIVYTQDREGAREDYYSDDEYCDLPLAILINEMSASASEVLAAAVQDFDRGRVIGVQSYGKGVVQSLVFFEEDGAGMQYTSSSYYTPSGRNIHGTGVTPDRIVNTEDGYQSYSGIPNLQEDVQLRTAVGYLKENIA